MLLIYSIYSFLLTHQAILGSQISHLTYSDLYFTRPLSLLFIFCKQATTLHSSVTLTGDRLLFNDLMCVWSFILTFEIMNISHHSYSWRNNQENFFFNFISQFYAIYCVFFVIIPHTNVNWQNNIKHNLHNILLFILCTCTHIFRGKKVRSWFTLKCTFYPYFLIGWEAIPMRILQLLLARSSWGFNNFFFNLFFLINTGSYIVCRNFGTKWQSISMQFLNWSRAQEEHCDIFCYLSHDTFLESTPISFWEADDMLVLNVHEAHDCHWNAFTPSFYDNTNDAFTPKARKMTHGVRSQSKWKDANRRKSAFNTTGDDAILVINAA